MRSAQSAFCRFVAEGGLRLETRLADGAAAAIGRTIYGRAASCLIPYLAAGRWPYAASVTAGRVADAGRVMSVADYAVIGDLHQVVPAISAEIRRVSGRQL
jgi:hypothetical protein